MYCGAILRLIQPSRVLESGDKSREQQAEQRCVVARRAAHSMGLSEARREPRTLHTALPVPPWNIEVPRRRLKLCYPATLVILSRPAADNSSRAVAMPACNSTHFSNNAISIVTPRCRAISSTINGRGVCLSSLQSAAWNNDIFSVRDLPSSADQGLFGEIADAISPPSSES
jgi:hypothetical protein